MLEPTLENVLEQTSLRWVFVGGKGGVGKTTTSCALGMMLAERRSSVLIVSTDPAHNLSDAFDQRFSGTPTLVTGFSNLYCLEIDNKVSEESVGADEPGSGETAGLMKFMSELTASLPGWDEVMGFNAILKTVRSSTFDCVVFDTAPTGHTLRLLALPQVGVQ